MEHDARQRQRSLTLRTPAQRGPGRRLRRPKTPVRTLAGRAHHLGGAPALQLGALAQPTPTRSPSASSRRRWPTARSSRTTTPRAHLRQPGVGTDLHGRRHPSTSRHRCRPTCCPLDRRLHRLRCEEAGIVYTFEQPSPWLSVILNSPAVPADQVRRIWFVFRRMGRAAHSRAEHGQEQGQDLRPQGDEDHVRRRRGRR